MIGSLLLNLCSSPLGSRVIEPYTLMKVLVVLMGRIGIRKTL